LVAGNGELTAKYYNGKFNAYQRTYIITTKPEYKNISVKYLYKFFSKYIEQLRQLSIGGVIKYIKLGNLTDATLPVPPREEQERIVAELDCLSGVIERKREQLKQLDALAQSIFYQMFGDPITNEKGWEVKKLGEVCEDKKKILRASKKCVLDDIINYIDISAIDNINNVINIPTPYIFEEAPSRAQQVVQLGDVIVSMVRPNLKNIAIVNCNYNNLIASSGFCVLRARKEITIPFLFYIVKSDAFTMYLMDRVSGANYPAVRESDITDYISIVPPITLQQEFADKIEAIEKQEELIKQSIAETETLFNARMDYYFN
jgi:type I restriction enzyme S subunit